MSLTKAQNEALDFVKNNEVFLVDGKFVSTTSEMNKRWANSFKILLEKGEIYKASLRTNYTPLKAL